jgi:hypothetical protein
MLLKRQYQAAVLRGQNIGGFAMSIKINRRHFISSVLAGTVAALASLSGVLISSRRHPFNLYRISFGSYGGTSCWRHASIATRLAQVPKQTLVRDWAVQKNAFIVNSKRNAKDIIADARVEKEYVKVEVSPELLISKYHRRKLPLHNYFRAKTGLTQINLDRFAERYPGLPERKWICLYG